MPAVETQETRYHHELQQAQREIQQLEAAGERLAQGVLQAQQSNEMLQAENDELRARLTAPDKRATTGRWPSYAWIQPHILFILMNFFSMAEWGLAHIYSSKMIPAGIFACTTARSLSFIFLAVWAVAACRVYGESHLRNWFIALMGIWVFVTMWLYEIHQASPGAADARNLMLLPANWWGGLLLNQTRVDAAIAMLTIGAMVTLYCYITVAKTPLQMFLDIVRGLVRR